MIRIVATLAFIVGVIAASGAWASRPVKKEVSACVVDGRLTSGPYTYRVRRDVGSADVDLRRYEGKRIRVRGYLLPSDILIAKSIEIVSNHCPSRR